MAVDWQLRESGPTDAERTVLLLPGGMCSAGSYAEVMSQSALAQTHLVAATLPGQAGAPSPNDYGVEDYARHVTELATRVGADAVSGSAWVRSSRSRWSHRAATGGRSSCSASACRPRTSRRSSGRSSARPASWETCR